MWHEFTLTDSKNLNPAATLKFVVFYARNEKPWFGIREFLLWERRATRDCNQVNTQKS